MKGLDAIIPFLASLVVSSVLSLIVLGLVCILREGFSDPDRRSLSSAMASWLGYLGLLSLPLAGVVVIWDFLANAHDPSAALGIVGGIILGFCILGRPALRMKARSR